MDKKIITMIEIRPGVWMSPADIHSKFTKEYEQAEVDELDLLAIEVGKTFLILSWLVIVAVTVASICWPA